MSHCVVDASAVILAIVDKTDVGAGVGRRLAAAGRRHAPHLIDAEVGSGLRRHAIAGLLEHDQALTGLRAGAALVDHRYSHTGAQALLAWELRDNLTFYDALYVALAATLDLPLLTADARLAGAPGLPCAVELV